MLNRQDIHDMIMADLECDRERHVNARTNVDYYNCKFDKYLYRNPPERQEDNRTKRTSALVSKVVKVQCSNLYRMPPTRTIPGHEQATKFLQDGYKRNAMFALMPAADRMAMLTQTAALQYVGTEDPKNPIRIHLWNGGQFSVFHDSTDLINPAEVVTVEEVQTDVFRYRRWSPDKIWTYMTDTVNPKKTASGFFSVKLVKEEDNPYKVLPFSFVHFDFPTEQFWSGCPGDQLREANAYLNYNLMDTADAKRYLAKPMLVGSNLHPEDEIHKPFLPGDVKKIRGSGEMIGDKPSEPKLEYLQNNANFLTADWEDLENFINHTLQMHNCPPVSVRQVEHGSRSGISIMAEQAPLVLHAKSRQLPFFHYESQAAKTYLTVAAAHLESNGLESGFIRDALDGFELSIKWGDPNPDMPGPERDNNDKFELETGLTSNLQILMKRHNFTKEDARAYQKEIREDKNFEDGLGTGRKEIYQYHIENDLMDGDEVRAYLGYPPMTPEMKKLFEARQLFNVLNIARVAGVPLKYAGSLIGIDIPDEVIEIAQAAKSPVEETVKTKNEHDHDQTESQA